MRIGQVVVVAAGVLAASGCSGGTNEDAKGADRAYFIAADQVIWDYAPDGENRITAEPFGEDEDVFVAHREDRIGSRYVKCIYRGYRDDSFGTRLERPESEQYLGFLGPVIRAEVGDTVTVTFRNNCKFPTSIHAHGVFYDKDSEGAPYADGTDRDAKADDEVAPGDTYTYRWEVPDRAGPGPMDGSSALWMYHSHTDPVGDVYAGLSGFLVVTARGEARPDGSPSDVDREVFSLFEVVDENSSPLLEDNIKQFTTGAVDVANEEFVESNLMHSINGFVYGNGPTLSVREDEQVRWYLMAMGTEVDLHTPHWHGNTVTVNGMRTDVTNLLPATMQVADMRPDDPGTWMFHCHVADHISAGMEALYQVIP